MLVLHPRSSLAAVHGCVYQGNSLDLQAGVAQTSLTRRLALILSMLKNSYPNQPLISVDVESTVLVLRITRSLGILAVLSEDELLLLCEIIWPVPDSIRVLGSGLRLIQGYFALGSSSHTGLDNCCQLFSFLLLINQESFMQTYKASLWARSRAHLFVVDSPHPLVSAAYLFGRWRS